MLVNSLKMARDLLTSAHNSHRRLLVPEIVKGNKEVRALQPLLGALVHELPEFSRAEVIPPVAVGQDTGILNDYTDQVRKVNRVHEPLGVLLEAEIEDDRHRSLVQPRKQTGRRLLILLNESRYVQDNPGNVIA